MKILKKKSQCRLCGCKKLINSEGIKTPEEYVEFYNKTYKEFAEKKERIPMSPRDGYKKDWISWRVFLETGQQPS